MIKNILFDFDGVILDSMKIKGDGFAELFKAYSQSSIEKLEAYHYANGGVSRFEKIRYFFREITKTEISEADVDSLSTRFGEIIADKLFDPDNLIAQTVAYIQQHCTRYNCHIVSGAEHHELNTLCAHFKIADYFKSIEGSPTAKSDLIRNLLQKNGYRADETVLIGDSINDYEAAKANGITFFGFNNTALKPLGKYIETFLDFHP